MVRQTTCHELKLGLVSLYLLDDVANVVAHVSRLLGEIGQTAEVYSAWFKGRDLTSLVRRTTRSAPL